MIKSRSRILWQLVLPLGCMFFSGCDTKPAASSSDDSGSSSAINATPEGTLAVAPVTTADGTVVAAVPPATSTAVEKPAETEKSPDANDDGLPDDAHVFDIPEGTNAEILQFIAEAPGRMLSASDEEKGGLAITTAAEKVLKNNPTPAERRVAAEAMFFWLQRLQAFYAREAADVQLYWKLRVAEYEQTDDPELAKLVGQYRILNQALDWNHLRPDQRDEFAAQLPNFFAERALDETDLETAQQVAQSILNAGDRPAAIGIYHTLAEILKQSKQEDIAAEAGKLAGMAHRLESVGQEISIEATKVDGQPLDWASYRGKVVLIDYWATWCGPCIAELPNIRKLYDIYHERGFDVIGVSVDTNKEELEAFIKKNELPWTVTFYESEDSPGLSQPLAMQFGISTVPVALLVDQEGRLISLEARGDDLAAWLERLLGPADITKAAAAEEPAAESPSADKADEAAPAEEKPAEEKPSTDASGAENPAEGAKAE